MKDSGPFCLYTKMNVSMNIALQVVTRYISDLPQLENRLWTAASLNNMRYVHYWSNQALSLILANLSSTRSPLYLLEEYANRLDSYALLNAHYSYMYSVGYDTVNDILDRVMSALHK